MYFTLQAGRPQKESERMKIIKPKATQKAKPQKKKELPPDTYAPLMDASELVIDESRKFVFNVQRGGEEGLPCVDIRTFQTTEAYTGFTRKGINFPLDMLPDLIRILEEVSEAADKKKLFDEFEE
jgi:hypothetical protein